MTTHSVEELDNLGKRFHTWKQNNPYRRVPKAFWDDAFKLIDKHSLDDVARSIGYASSYILHKRKKWPVTSPAIKFVEIQPSQPKFDLNPIQVKIQNYQGVLVELSFQGCVEQIFSLVSSLVKEGNPCSK